MIVVMKSNTPAREIERVNTELSRLDIVTETITGKYNVLIGLVGDMAEFDPLRIQKISSSIEKVLRIRKPFKRASREFRNGEPTQVVIPTPNGPVTLGQNRSIVHVAGPCSVENQQMILQTAHRLKAVGVHLLRGGAYKPRTSPYAFQGHGEKALNWLATARDATGLGIVTEVLDAADLDKITEVADALQVGARNMQNFSLLKKVGATGKPILLKRGLSATIEEWLMAAEYILATGNPNVILCERGIRSFDSKHTRNTLDLAVVPVLKALTHLPIMIDPSHATGKAEYVPAMAMAAIGAGADGLMIEVHLNPAKALSDGPQSLTLERYDELVGEMAVMSKALGRWSQTGLLPAVQRTGTLREGAAMV